MPVPARLAIVAGLSMAAVHAPAQLWTTASSGDWFDPLNWTPMDVPNVPGESASITASGSSYTVTVDGNPTIDTMSVSSDATISIDTRTLTIWGGSLTNNGTVLVNADPGFGGSIQFRNTVAASLTGAGTVILSANANSFSARIGRGAFDPTVLSIGAGQTITGRGIVSIPFINNGLISADADVLTLSTGFAEPTASPAAIEAVSGGRLDLRNINLDLNGTGVVTADNAEVRFNGGTFQQRLASGTVNTANGGVLRSVSGNADLENIVLNGDAAGDLRRGFRFFGAFFENNGSVTVTGDGVNGFDALRIQESPYDFAGSGEMVLEHPPMTNPGAAPTISDEVGGALLNNLPLHTIRGKGRLGVITFNLGTVSADAPGESFDLLQPFTNAGLLHATNTGILKIGNTVTQVGSGEIVLDNGLLDFIGTPELDGGMVTGINGGKIRVRDGNVILSDIVLDTDTDVLGQTVFADDDIVNNGTMLVQRDGGNFGFVRILRPQTWGGAGEIVLAASEGDLRDAQITRNTAGDTLTHAAGHTIRGTGEINTRTVNSGLIAADVPGRVLLLRTEDHTNSGVIRADGGIVEIRAITVDQTDSGSGAGRLEAAGAGEIRFTSGASVVGGTIDGTARSIGPGGGFDAVTNNGLLAVEASAAVFRNTITNNGAIRVDQLIGAFPGVAEIADTVELAGNGELGLNPINGTGAHLRNATPGATLVNGVDHAIRGTGQFVSLNVENRGLLAPGRTTAGERIGEFAYTNTTDIICAPSSVIELQIAGAAPGEFDRIRSFGAATSTFHCAGTLALENISGFVGLVPGDVLELINAPGGLTGTFDTVSYPGQINFRIDYEPTGVNLVFLCVADVNQDEAVDILDVVAFVNVWNAQGPGADFNEDGTINILDVVAFIDLWNAGCQ
jgi:hypothetical protein